jgi:hypothetical protein
VRPLGKMAIIKPINHAPHCRMRTSIIQTWLFCTLGYSDFDLF